MSFNRFSASTTAEILYALANSPSLDTIREIDLAASADFSQEDSHEALADLLASAPNLTLFNIELAEGTKIQVEVTYGDSAMVRVINQESGTVIERDTDRLKEVKIRKDDDSENDDDCGSSDSGSDRS